MDATSFSSCYDPDECYMTKEILMEILFRLPVKSIFKFRSVSREWLSLLSSSYFVDIYKTRMCQWTLVHKNLYHHEPHYYWYSIPPPPNYDLFNNLNSFGSKSKSPSFSILPPRWSLEFPEEENQKKAVIIEEILGSSNGWLLCTSINPQLIPCTILHLINPLTMQCISLPDSFFPNEVCFGFVTKAEGDVITSFRLVTLIWPSYTRFNVSTPFLVFREFCSETRAWKKSRIYIDQFDQHSVEISPRFDKVAFTLGNVLHWFNGATILAYYLDNGGSGHKCRFISLPADRTIWTNDHYEGRDCLPANWMAWFNGRYERRGDNESSESDSMCGVAQDGCITYVEMVGLGKRGFKEGGLTVWKLRDYYKGEWSLEHRVENRDIVFDPRLRKPLTRLLAFHPLDSEMLYLGQRCDFIFSYNIRLRKLEVVQSPMHEDEGRVICCRGDTLPFVLQWPTRLGFPSLLGFH